MFALRIVFSGVGSGLEVSETQNRAFTNLFKFLVEYLVPFFWFCVGTLKAVL